MSFLSSIKSKLIFLLVIMYGAAVNNNGLHLLRHSQIGI